MKKLLLLLALVFLAALNVRAQGVRLDPPSVTSALTLSGNVFITIPASPVIRFCNAPANAVPCSNLATTYTSATLGTPCSTSTPIVLQGTTNCVASPDAQNNWGVWVTAGQYAYTISVGGANFGPFYITAAGGGVPLNVNNGTCPLTEILSFTVCGPSLDPSHTKGSLEVIGQGAGPGQIIITNSSDPANTGSTRVDYGYISQTSSNALAVGNAKSSSGNLGAFTIGPDGTTEFGDDLTDATTSEFLVQGSTGGGQIAGEADIIVNSVDFLRCAKAGTCNFTVPTCWAGSVSGTACIFVPSAAGAPNQINLPTTTGSAGQVLQTNGGSPQQTAWVSIIQDCGSTSGGTQNCAKTPESPAQIIRGDVQLNTATSQSITTLPFTSATSYSCSGSDLTNSGAIVGFNTYAAASVTITENGGANTDHLRYICIGF